MLFFAIYSATFADEPAGNTMSRWGRNSSQTCAGFHQNFSWKRFGSRKKGKRGRKKKKKSFIQNEISKSIAFGAELSGNPLLSLRSCCKMEVLPAGSFSPVHRLRMSGLSWKRNPSPPILKSRYTLSLAFSWALFQLISINSQEAVPYINRQLGLGIYFAEDFVIAS